MEDLKTYCVIVRTYKNYLFFFVYIEPKNSQIASHIIIANAVSLLIDVTVALTSRSSQAFLSNRPIQFNAVYLKRGM